MRKNKHNLPVFDNDREYLKAFQDNSVQKEKKNSALPQQKQNPKTQNKSGQILQALNEQESPKEENFAALLEEFFQKNQAKPLKKPDPVPLKKRLKRYPPPEAVLDLHGLKAIEAQTRAESFIYTCKMQGFFTIRIIVGKGLHSEWAPVLPDVVEDVLVEMKKKNLVLGFDWDKKAKTVSGSVIVYLQQFERYL